MDVLPDDLIGVLVPLLDVPSRLPFSCTSARLRARFRQLRPRLAPAPLESSWDEALDPYRLSPAFLAECVQHDYLDLISWAVSLNPNIAPAQLLLPLERGGCGGFYAPRLTQALARSPSFAAHALLHAHGLPLKEFIDEAISTNHQDVCSLIERRWKEISAEQLQNLLAGLAGYVPPRSLPPSKVHGSAFTCLPED